MWDNLLHFLLPAGICSQFISFLSLSVGSSHLGRSHVLAELRTLSRNFRLNFTTYTGYMYIYIQHAFKCAIFYHKHSPACKAKAKDRNIGCKWTFIFSVFLGQVFASYSRHRILCLFSLSLPWLHQNVYFRVWELNILLQKTFVWSEED